MELSTVNTMPRIDKLHFSVQTGVSHKLPRLHYQSCLGCITWAASIVLSELPQLYYMSCLDYIFWASSIELYKLTRLYYLSCLDVVSQLPRLYYLSCLHRIIWAASTILIWVTSIIEVSRDLEAYCKFSFYLVAALEEIKRLVPGDI